MRKSSWLFFGFLFVSNLTLIAQKTAIYTSKAKDFEKAVSLYADDQFASVQIIFDQVGAEIANETIKSDCAFYAASCAVRLGRSNAGDRMEAFISDYPTSPKSNRAFVELAHYNFEQGNYQEALTWFEKSDESQLEYLEKDRFNFQKGYSFFRSNNKKKAVTYLTKVLKSDQYGSQAKYYLGFMAYEGDDFQEASKYFDAVSDGDRYKEKLSYYQADMSFKGGDFDKAIDLGQKALLNSNALEKSELNKIIGESYFNLKKYDQAIPYLLGYRGKKGKWNNTDYYQLGYAYYKEEEYVSAIAQFNKIIGGDDVVAQNAYYHLGESYMKMLKKQEALNAFKNSSEMDFNEAIKEDAALNYAKLSYELGNSYQSVPSVLLNFIEKYPNNGNRSTIEKLLISSYISSKNYKEAIALIEKNKSPENNAALQKVSFYRGLELFVDRDYENALKIFDKSLFVQVDPLYAARAIYWKAETEYVLEDFNNALLSYKQFLGMSQASLTPEYTNSKYSIAYTYFKLKEYDLAGNNFQKYIESLKNDKNRLSDSYLRLADSRFVTSKYWPAMEAYNKVIELKSLDADYAYFQKALCYGFVSKNDRKIEDLNSFLKLYPKSAYRDDALFELANTYVVVDKQDLALKTYDHLISDYKNGVLASKALLRQGLVYYNSDRNNEALVKLKKVASDYPKTPEAMEAVSTARLIYVDTGKVNEYADWVKTLDFVAVTDAELDNDTYESAFKQFEQNKNDQAISGFRAYISSFPNGIHSLHANFYLAQTYFAKGEKDKTIPYYQYVIEQSSNEFTEQSLTRLSQVLLEEQNSETVIPVLLRLEAEADLYQNKIFAQSNLMKSYYEIQDYGKAVTYAEKVLSNPKIDDFVKSDGQIIIARSAIQTGEENKARAAYAKVSAIAKGELAAEALYYDAYFKNRDEKFELSNVSVQNLAKNYSSYRYFGAKGLILMAKNFYGLNDSFQATYILESVIKNFSDFSDVIAEAQTELDLIKSEEAKTNSSIDN